jgi:hypothetical protein
VGVKKGESGASRRVIAFCRIEEWTIPLPCLCGRKGDFSSGRSIIVKRENNFSMNPAELQEQFKAYVEQLSPERLRVAADFFEYLADR